MHTTDCTPEKRCETFPMNHDLATFHEKKGMVDYATIDHRGNIKIVAIMNFLQNAASEHAARMGASGFDLAEKDLGWVIHRYHIRINGTAPWRTPLSIKTFRFPHRNLYEMRQMTLATQSAINDSDVGRLTVDALAPVGRNLAESAASSPPPMQPESPHPPHETPAHPKDSEKSTPPLAQATVCWVMVSKKNGKPVRLGKFMSPALCAPLSSSALHQNSKAIGYEMEYSDNKDSSSNPLPCDDAVNGHGRSPATPDHGNNVPISTVNASPDNEKAFYHFPDIDPVERVDFELPFKVRMHDLDLNGHVNNAIFVEWAVETVPKEILASCTPMVIDVLFQKEALYGDTIRSQTQIVSPAPHIPDNATVRPSCTTKNESCDLSLADNHFQINSPVRPPDTPKYESHHQITRISGDAVLAKLSIQWQETTERQQGQTDPH